MTQQLLTLGHGTATENELARLIREAAIESIVDVRYPRAAVIRNSGREEMERWVPEKTGSTYLWEPVLGGFRKANRNSANVALRHPSFRAYADYMETDAFTNALATLLVRMATVRVAILCSETVCGAVTGG